MSALYLALTVAVFAVAGLTIRAARLRGELAEARRALLAYRSSGTERLAVLEEANEVLRCKNRQLRTRLADLQEEFVGLTYSVSHDLRAPLRSINGFSEALTEDYGSQLEGTAHDYLQRVGHATRQLNAMVDALLRLSRLVQAPLRLETVDLSALAHETLRELAVAEPHRRVEWYVQEGVTAQGDRPLLADALRQLLGNAWKFSAVRTVAHLAFRARPEDLGGSSLAETVYEVSDDGVGFDPRYAGKLFGVFQRLHTPEEFPGLGVGLAAARRSVRRHGGRIWSSAEPDGGATFSFTLPPEASGTPAAPQPAAPPRAVLPVPADVEPSAPPRPSVV